MLNDSLSIVLNENDSIIEDLATRHSFGSVKAPNNLIRLRMCYKYSRLQIANWIRSQPKFEHDHGTHKVRVYWTGLKQTKLRTMLETTCWSVDRTMGTYSVGGEADRLFKNRMHFRNWLYWTELDIVQFLRMHPENEVEHVNFVSEWGTAEFVHRVFYHRNADLIGRRLNAIIGPHDNFPVKTLLSSWLWIRYDPAETF